MLALPAPRARANLVLAACSGILFGLLGLGLVLNLDLARFLTHTVGVFVVLAELLREGVLYPATPDPQLVYTTFYHPLAFAPYALLPASGLDLVWWIRLVVGLETLLCLTLVALLCRRTTGRAGLVVWQPALWAACTVPVAFSLVGMRDDPRGALLGLAALFAWERWRAATTGGLLLAAAFFAKATAPFAPALAIAAAALRAGPSSLLRFTAALGLAVAGGVVFLQWGLGTDFLHQGLWWALVEPAHAPRTIAQTFTALGVDLVRDLALPLLLFLSAVRLGLQVRRRQLDRFDVLVLAVWAKTLLAYRSHGTDLNHLFDLTLFAALHAGLLVVPRLRPGTGLAALLAAALLGLPWTWKVLLPPPDSPPLRDAPVAQAAAALRSLEPVPTLCEEPLLSWLAGRTAANGLHEPLRPVVTDPFLTFAALRRHPRVREIWFGPAEHPLALQRIVLMRDPFQPPNGGPAGAAGGEWYGDVHFDRAFVDELRARWQIVVRGGGAVVLHRQQH